MGSIVILALYPLTGCGVAEQIRLDYNATQNTTTYKLNVVPLCKFKSGLGIHEGDSDMFAETPCRDRDCEPKKAELHFRFAKTARQQGNTATFRTEEPWIQVNKIRITWKDPLQHLFDQTLGARPKDGDTPDAQ